MDVGGKPISVFQYPQVFLELKELFICIACRTPRMVMSTIWCLFYLVWTTYLEKMLPKVLLQLIFRLVWLWNLWTPNLLYINYNPTKRVTMFGTLSNTSLWVFPTMKGLQQSMCLRVRSSQLSCKHLNFIQFNTMTCPCKTRFLMSRFWKGHDGIFWQFMHNFMVFHFHPLCHQLLRLQCVLATERLPIRSCLLPVRVMAQEQPPVQERGNILERIQAATPKTKDVRPLDPSRAMGMDERDPRVEQAQWPCFGHHVPAKAHSNAHGQWTQCSVCNLRLNYVPKVGSHSGSTKVENRAMVVRMLTELQPLMRGAKPTAAICLAMQKKIDAEETLTHMIDKEFMAQNPMGYTVGGRPKAKAFPTRASTTVEPVQTPRSTAENQLGCDSRITSSSQRLGEPPHCRGEEPACAAHDRASPSSCGINTCAGAREPDCGLRGRHGVKTGIDETLCPCGVLQDRQLQGFKGALWQVATLDQ